MAGYKPGRLSHRLSLAHTNAATSLVRKAGERKLRGRYTGALRLPLDTAKGELDESFDTRNSGAVYRCFPSQYIVRPIVVA